MGELELELEKEQEQQEEQQEQQEQQEEQQEQQEQKQERAVFFNCVYASSRVWRLGFRCCIKTSYRQSRGACCIKTEVYRYARMVKPKPKPE